MPSASASVVYPQGTKFNMDYYLSTHMPLVQKLWSSHGLKSWQVVQMSDDQPYCVQAILTWESPEAIDKALASSDTKAVFDDVSNFSDKAPTFLKGAVVGSS